MQSASTNKPTTTKPGLTASEIIQSWPEESREAAQLVIDSRGEPNEITDAGLTWRNVEPWKRMVATRNFHEHKFPVPHIDAVESFIDYKVPVEMFTPLAKFDGSVMVERTSGEVSARCHDEQANLLALNLMNDIVQGNKTVDEARGYYTKEFLDYRRGESTPYMDELKFSPEVAHTADPDVRTISPNELEQAKSNKKS